MPRNDEPYYEVRLSPIHGNGLFARRDIPEGEDIIEYKGERISKDESNRRGTEWDAKAKQNGAGRVYIFTLDDEWDIDGNTDDNDAKYANHHCEPNCEAIIHGDSIWLSSTRDIKKGEELFFDYGYGIEHFLEHPCKCGAPTCPGYIVSRDQRWRVRRILRGRRSAQAAAS